MDSLKVLFGYISHELGPKNGTSEYKFASSSYHEPYFFEKWISSREFNVFLYQLNKFSFGLGILYILMLKWGPKFMENRKPMELRKPLAFWNFFLSALSGFMFYRASMDYFSIWINGGLYEALCLR